MLNRTAYRYVVVGLLLTMMGVLTGLFSPGQSDTDLSVVSVQVHLPVILATAALYGILLWNLVSSPRRYLRALSQQGLLLPLLAFCVLSAAWSSDPSLVLRRVLFLLLTCVVGIIVGTDFKIAEIGRMLAAASLLHLVLCAFFLVFARQYMFTPVDPNALKGLTTHKNVFGLEQGLALIAFAFCPFQRFRWLRWPLVAISAGTLLWSHSSGSLIATLVALALSPFFLVHRFKSVERVPVIGVAVLAFGALMTTAVLGRDQIPALFSKDATLTGRTELWSLVMIAIRSHPWLGFGYDSFWRGLEGDSLAVIRGVGWLVPTAHNGYLDALLSVGIVGTAMLAVVLVQFLFRAFVHTTQGEGSSRYFPLVFLVLLIVYNLNESALLTRSGQPFFLFVALTTSMMSLKAQTRAAARIGHVTRPRFGYAGPGSPMAKGTF